MGCNSVGLSMGHVSVKLIKCDLIGCDSNPKEIHDVNVFLHGQETSIQLGKN